MYVPPVRGIGFPHKPHQFLYYPLSKAEMDGHEIATFLNEATEVTVSFTI